MIVLPELAMKQLMTQIVQATHGLVDTAGEPVITNTIAEPQLRMAALVAVQIATGNACWPGDRKIVLRRPKVSNSIFAEE